jgi:multiple sugar transport system permease protein
MVRTETRGSSVAGLASSARPQLRGRLSSVVVRQRSGLLPGVVFYTVLSLAALLFMLPVIWVLLSSFKPTQDVLSTAPLSLPHPFSLQNYRELFQLAPVGLWFRNSLIYSAGSTAGAVLSSTLAGYGFARRQTGGSQALLISALAVLMVPFVVTIFPLYAFYLKLGWLNTFFPLIIPSFFGVGGTTLFIFLMRQLFLNIPHSLEEAAALDGASALQAFRRIILPLAKPGIVTVAIFQFVFSWNDFFGPLIFLTNSNLYTLPLGVATFSSAYGTDIGPLMSLTLLSLIPVIVVFLIFQRYFVTTMATVGLQ